MQYWYIIFACFLAVACGGGSGADDPLRTTAVAWAVGSAIDGPGLQGHPVVVRSEDGGFTWGAPTSLPAIDAARGFVARAIAFSSTGTGWTVGDRGPFTFADTLVTRDHGASWTSQASNFAHDAGTVLELFDVHASAAAVVVVGGDHSVVSQGLNPDGVVFRSVDEGASWRRRVSTRPGPFRSVCLTALGVGAAVGFSHISTAIAVTTRDGGERWQEISRNMHPQPTALHAVACASPEHLWFTGSFFNSEAGILYSPDGGTTWFDRTPAASGGRGVGPIDFVDQDTGWALSSRIMFRTDDGGRSWVAQEFPLPPERVTWHDLEFVDRNHGVAVGTRIVGGRAQGGFAIVSADGGRTWHESSLSQDVRDLRGVTLLEQGGPPGSHGAGRSSVQFATR